MQASDVADSLREIGSGAIARVQHIDILCREPVRNAESVLQRLVHLDDHVADYFRRRVPDTQLVAQNRVEGFKERFVEKCGTALSSLNRKKNVDRSTRSSAADVESNTSTRPNGFKRLVELKHLHCSLPRCDQNDDQRLQPPSRSRRLNGAGS